MIWKLLVCVRTCSLFNQSPVSMPNPADPIVPICFKLSRFICNQLQIHDRARMGGDMSNLQVKKMPSDL
ncbi:hypothetical protein XELAEV_18003260mg [Xenopus laevis]|nr:hypothetical protein XELAEV_18003260mg [Xenopus laevis]